MTYLQGIRRYSDMDEKRFTWNNLKLCRESVREAQIAGIMRLVEQYPFLDVCIGEIPPFSAIEAASRYPLCDGVLIIFDRSKEQEKMKNEQNDC